MRHADALGHALILIGIAAGLGALTGALLSAMI